MRDYIGYETLLSVAKADNLNQWMYEKIRPYAKGNILEIGSGLGNISKFFIRNGAEITLSDIDSSYIEQLIKEFQTFSNVKGFLSVDLQKDNFPAVYNHLIGKFDTVFYLNVLEHIKDDSYAIQNSRLLLKENGVLIILVPAYSFLYSEMDKQLNHYRRYTLTTLRNKISEENFSIVKSFYFNFMGIPAWLYGKIRKFKVLPKGEMNLYNKLTPIGKLLDTIVFNKAGLSAIVVARKNNQ